MCQENIEQCPWCGKDFDNQGEFNLADGSSVCHSCFVAMGPMDDDEAEMLEYERAFDRVENAEIDRLMGE